MNTRQVQINKEDIQDLETELKEQSANLSAEQKNFLSYLVSRAKAGLATAPTADVVWTWTYNF